MQNLFNYATSELSQDAFLRWLFESYKCENKSIAEAAHALLGKMTGIKNLKCGTVSELRTDRQVKHTDVVVDFKHNGERHILVIEDKTFSTPHDDQFKRYQKEIRDVYADVKESCFFYAYYKTYLGSPKESAEAIACGWKPLFLDEICSFFYQYPYTDCLIFDQYREHIFELKRRMENYPNISIAEWKESGKIMFHAYITKELFSFVNDRNDVLEPPSTAGWHSYCSLWVERIRQDNIKFSLEISFHPDWEYASATVRLSGYKSEETICCELKDWVWRELTANGRPFKTFNGKWCIAKGKEKLNYMRGTKSMSDLCKRLIFAFADVCKAMNKELSKHPEWCHFPNMAINA